MKKVVLKQHFARFYSIFAYVIALTIVAIPLAVFDTIVFGSIIYWYRLACLPCHCWNPCVTQHRELRVPALWAVQLRALCRCGVRA